MTKLFAVATVVAGMLAPNAAAPARLGVTARDFSFALSRTTVKHGSAIVELDNFGEDIHDLRLRRIGGSRTYALPETKPGERAQLDLHLRPGRYRLWCSIADHRQQGMYATFRVK